MTGDLLADAERVHVGGVEEVDARLGRPPRERRRLLLAERPLPRCRVSVAHHAQTDPRDLEAGLAQSRVLHRPEPIAIGPNLSRDPRSASAKNRRHVRVLAPRRTLTPPHGAGRCPAGYPPVSSRQSTPTGARCDRAERGAGSPRPSNLIRVMPAQGACEAAMVNLILLTDRRQ